MGSPCEAGPQAATPWAVMVTVVSSTRINESRTGHSAKAVTQGHQSASFVPHTSPGARGRRRSCLGGPVRSEDEAGCSALPSGFLSTWLLSHHLSVALSFHLCPIHLVLVETPI